MQTKLRLTAIERKRREEANIRAAIKRDGLCRAGLCRCGKPRLWSKRLDRFLRSCKACAAALNKSSLRRYYEGNLVKPERKEPVLDPTLKNSRGVRRVMQRDGMGREAWWWVATCNFNYTPRSRRWSIDKYGDAKARKLAQKQRDSWEVEAWITAS